ncbi:pilus assembly protein PilM [Microbacterium esteraromaticum]|uniref:pilus assembly protein PilM n=1 Tax=Microbacterium esteraromaticum TaxID=57043 RepID=UPI0030A5C319
MAKTITAVEITEDSVRAAEVELGRTPTLHAAGEVRLPAGTAKDSEVIDRDAVAVAMRQLWSEGRFKGKNVTIGVASRRILVREHSTPLRNAVQIRQALPFQVQDLLPVPVEQAVLDFYPAMDDGSAVHGLLVAAVSETIEELIATVSQAKLHTDAVDLTAFGLSRVLGALAPSGTTALIIDIGEHTTQLVIAVDGVPRFIRVIPVDVVPSRSDESVATNASVPSPLVDPSGGSLRSARRRARAEEAESLPTATPAPLTPEQQSALVDLAGKLRGTLSFYLGRPGALPIDVAWVSGAGSLYEQMCNVLNHIVGVDVTPLTALAVARSRVELDPGLAARLLPTVAIAMGGAR